MKPEVHYFSYSGFVVVQQIEVSGVRTASDSERCTYDRRSVACRFHAHHAWRHLAATFSRQQTICHTHVNISLHTVYSTQLSLSL